jgi:hypothetical protein
MLSVKDNEAEEQNFDVAEEEHVIVHKEFSPV